ncbi:MAG: hypothetical protein WCL32_15115 [Planctomycetota bacterium]
MIRRRIAGAALVAVVLIQGCVGADGGAVKSFHQGAAEKATEGSIQQVQALWENRVITTPDVANRGAPLIGLAGRIYFFGEEVGHPRAAKGTLTVDAHEVLPDGKTRMLERWEIDPRTLMKLGRKDTIGWGYTVFLPWSSYRPDIGRIQLQAKFVPEQNGTPLFTEQSSVSLRQEGPPVISSNIIPTSGRK